MREKLIELIQNSVGGCARHWAEIIADYLIANNVTILPEGAIILTRAEIDALNEHNEKVKRELAREIFAEIEKIVNKQYNRSLFGIVTDITPEIAELKKKYTEERK